MLKSKLDELISESDNQSLNDDMEDDTIQEKSISQMPENMVEKVDEDIGTFIESDNIEEVKEEESSKEENISVPADIREFIRKNPNSTVEFVSKYYSKKEIDKQLMLGRIYKKKGKLFI